MRRGLGSQYTAIFYGIRLAEPSAYIATGGDTIAKARQIGDRDYKTEWVRRAGPWCTVEDLESPADGIRTELVPTPQPRARDTPESLLIPVRSRPPAPDN